MMFSKLNQWVAIECDECDNEQIAETQKELFESGWVLMGTVHLCKECTDILSRRNYLFAHPDVAKCL